MSEPHVRKSDALVIAGASRGIGADFARFAARSGYQNLHLIARSEKKLLALKREIEGTHAGCSVHTHTRDLGSDADVTALVHDLQNEGEFPRHWVLSIGGTPSGKIIKEPFESTPWEQLRGLVELNLMAPMRVLHQVLPELLRPDARGAVPPASIVALGSQAGHHARAGKAVYAASKHGLYGLMRSIAEEVREVGIRVSVVSPGTVDTELHPPHPNLDRAKLIPPGDVSRAILFILECSAATAPFEVHLRPQRLI